MNNGDELIKNARDYIKFCLTMSCGHCFPCRLGLPKMFQILTAIAEDQHEGTELERLENLVHTMCQASLCPVGQTSPLPIKTLLEILKDGKKETGDIEKSLELIKCRSCGRPFAFKAFLEYFQASVDKSLEVHLDRDYCPECIRKVRAIDLVGEIVR
ncbi:MAG: NADH-ubiquinone oxidoreductase-F iron-sulfur binding region domain-containing protein [Candidatus Aquicultor sp.]